MRVTSRIDFLLDLRHELDFEFFYEPGMKTSGVGSIFRTREQEQRNWHQALTHGHLTMRLFSIT